MLRLLHGDMRETLRALPDNSVDSVVTDPPYHLTSIVKRFGADNAARAKVGATGVYARASAGFMGQQWDGGDVAFQPETWTEIWRVLKPGGHMVAFSGTRTYHRMVCAIEDAGFEIRDQLAWVYGSGFPKSHDVSKGIDKAAGVEREVSKAVPCAKGGSADETQSKGRNYRLGESRDLTVPATPEAERWQGWGTALKPAWEPICLARKPLSEPTVAANVLRWGTGAINIDGCRVGTDELLVRPAIERHDNAVLGKGLGAGTQIEPIGRWPANFVHDGSPDVLERFPAQAGALAPVYTHGADKFRNAYGTFAGNVDEAGSTFRGDSGSAARFFMTCERDFEQWLTANSAESHLPLQNLLAVFVQSDAAIAACPAGSLLSASSEQPFTNVTPSESRQLGKTLIGAIQIVVNAFWHESPPEKLTLSLNDVPFVVQITPTVITLTIPNLSISSGCAGHVIFNIMLPNLVPGDRAWRFKYCAKASKSERGEGNNHPTVKPVALMEWLVRMVTPARGVVLDPFLGSGSTAVAALREGFSFIGCELSAEHIAITERRLDALTA